MTLDPLAATEIDAAALCWLAAADAAGRLNVSPKEIFVTRGPDLLLIAEIASAQNAPRPRCGKARTEPAERARQRAEMLIPRPLAC